MFIIDYAEHHDMWLKKADTPEPPLQGSRPKSSVNSVPEYPDCVGILSLFHPDRKNLFHRASMRYQGSLYFVGTLIIYLDLIQAQVWYYNKNQTDQAYCLSQADLTESYGSLPSPP